MSGLTQKALSGFLTQNVRQVETAAQFAKALYDDNRHAAPVDLLFLGFLKDVICIYTPLTQMSVFPLEVRYKKAREELAKGQDISADAIANIDKYAKLPNADQIVVSIGRKGFSIFVILFRGYEAWLRAEVVGYQGNSSQYAKLLQEAASAFRQAEKLPPSLNRC